MAFIHWSDYPIIRAYMRLPKTVRPLGPILRIAAFGYPVPREKAVSMNRSVWTGEDAKDCAVIEHLPLHKADAAVIGITADFAAGAVGMDGACMSPLTGHQASASSIMASLPDDRYLLLYKGHEHGGFNEALFLRIDQIDGVVGGFEQTSFLMKCTEWPIMIGLPVEKVDAQIKTQRVKAERMNRKPVYVPQTARIS